mmetsp:Transcript_147516/g.374678  ORF Transcript_147516/g.374678 Transcript_147516/m.374678 type:complete len:232 (+) Transcript_147516:808-1503(+)
MTLLVRGCSLVPLPHVVALDCHVVVGDGEHRVLLLGDRLRARVDPRADQLQCAQRMLYRLVVLVHLRKDRANVKVSARNGRIVRLQRHLDLQRFPQVAQRRVQLPDLLVVATEVVASHGQEVRWLVLARCLCVKDGLCILELLEGLLVLTLAQEVHAILVAAQDQLLKILNRMIVMLLLEGSLRRGRIHTVVMPRGGYGRGHLRSSQRQLAEALPAVGRSSPRTHEPNQLN